MMSQDKFISQKQVLFKDSTNPATKMLPEIKTRLRTEQLRIMNKRSLSFIKKKVSTRNSILNACRPYLEELKHAGVNYSIKKRSKKLAKRDRIQSEVTPKNIYSVTRAQQYRQPQQKQQKFQTLPSTSVEVRSVKHQYSRKNKPMVEELMKYIKKVKEAKESDLNRSEIHLKNSRTLKRYIECEQQLLQLPQDKSEWTHDNTQNFTTSLADVNSFFKKLDKVVVLCLLKVGQIKLYEEQEILQVENLHTQKMGIVLWGQVLLKTQSNKNMKIYLFPGDSINEELVLAENNQSNSHIHYFKKGSVKIKQTAKAKDKTAILYLKLDEYNMIYQQLVKIGEKSSILKAQNMIKRSFAKKKNLRKQFSYL